MGPYHPVMVCVVRGEESVWLSMPLTPPLALKPHSVLHRGSQELRPRYSSLGTHCKSRGFSFSTSSNSLAEQFSLNSHISLICSPSFTCHSQLATVAHIISISHRAFHCTINLSMKLTTLLIEGLTFAACSHAHSQDTYGGTPQLLGGRKFLAELKGRSALPAPVRAPIYIEKWEPTEGRLLEERQNVNGNCGPGYGSCAASECCSPEGYRPPTTVA